MRDRKPPTDSSLSDGMLVMVLRRKHMPSGNGYFMATSLAPVDPRVWGGNARLAYAIKGSVVAPGNELRVLVECHCVFSNFWKRCFPSCYSETARGGQVDLFRTRDDTAVALLRCSPRLDSHSAQGFSESGLCVFAVHHGKRGDRGLTALRPGSPPDLPS
jgi:hypothetical protein